MGEVEQTPQKEPEKNAAQIFQEELLKESLGGSPKHTSGFGRLIQVATVPFLAIFTGLVLGAVIIVLTTPEFYTAWRQSVFQGLAEGWRVVTTAYSSLFTGAFGDPAKIVASLQSGNAEEISQSFLSVL